MQHFDIKFVDTFDLDFFSRFVSLKHRLYSDMPEFLGETTDEFEKLLASGCSFSKNHLWRAYLVSSGDEIVGRCLISVQTQKTDFACLGFFESIADFNCLKILRPHLEQWAKSHGSLEIRGPIHGDIFNGSRLLINQIGDRLFGDPLHPGYYPRFFDEAGFNKIKSWRTANYRTFQFAKLALDQNRKLRESREIVKAQNVRIRPIDLKNWQSELKVLYDISIDSYEEFSDFLPISFDEFSYFQRHTEKLVNPRYSYICEYQGEPIAFYLAGFDHYKILIRYRKLTKWLPDFLAKLVTIVSMPFSPPPFTIPYVGKTKRCEGKIKYISELATCHMVKRNPWLIFWKVYAGYVSEDSRMWVKCCENYCSESSTYAMFSLKFSLTNAQEKL